MDDDTVVVGSLCTGVAGLDLGLHAAYGGRTRLAWYSEVNPDASQVLAARLPRVPNLGDMTAVDWARVPRVDVLAAGFPCQPVSAAGKQKATADERWLWPHVRTAYRALRPQELVFENVRNLVSIQKGAIFAQICADLREDGYAVRYALAGACAVGAPHHRHRVFIVARYAWELEAPPAQRMTMIECGARRGKGRVLLPTPTASRYGNNQGGANPGGPVRHSLDAAHLLLPTPDASAGSRGGPQDGDVRRANGQSVALQDAICTVLAETGRIEFTNASRSGSRLIDPAADPRHGMLPTPTASDGHRGPNPPAYEADNLTTAVDRLDQPGPDSPGMDRPGELLPTPRARDGHGGDYDAARQQARRDRSAHGGPSLPDVAQQVLLPTPTAGDARNTRNATSRDPLHPRAGEIGYTLCDVTHDVDGAGELTGRAAAPDGSALLPTPLLPTPLLPTPRHTDADKGSPNQHGSRPGDLMLPSAVIGERYGRYAPAVALWEHLTRTAAPEPTIANSKGQWRLNPELPEWMMGYPRGWITGIVGRSAALRGAGNGVVPHVVAAVYPLITAGWPYLRGGDLHPEHLDRDRLDRTRAGRPQPAPALPVAPVAEQLALEVAGHGG